MTKTSEKHTLTSLATGGGCGCKLAPDLLSRLLHESKKQNFIEPNLLVGLKNSDDAAVWQLCEDEAIVATVDFFAPIVDDPIAFGQIAATNAISDVYAMGAKPLFALALAAMPKNDISEDCIAQIFEGGRKACHRVGIMVVGGHSIDAKEPLYGLVVIGKIDPSKLLKNANAKKGDCLLLTKPLGVGVLSAANKQGLLGSKDYENWITQLCQPNNLGEALSNIEGVSALTDVTGFGLMGHLLEMCEASQCGATVFQHQMPILATAQNFAKQGITTGAQQRNWESYQHKIKPSKPLEAWQKILLSDPQTSGGLLISCSSQALSKVQSIYLENNQQAIQIGYLTEDSLIKIQ